MLFRVIDCTGDADIAYMAGAEYRKTGELTFVKKKQKDSNNQEMRIFCAAKSEMMGMTTVFNASGVDKENFVKYTEEDPATYRVVFVLLNLVVEGDYHIFSFWLDPPNTGLVSYLGPGDHWKGRRPEESLS